MADLPSTPPLTKADLPEIVQRYVNGESIQEITPDARRCRQTIYNWIHNTVGEDAYTYIRRQAMITRMADADHELHAAQTKLDIARAEAECRYTRWDLERRWASQFGSKQEMNVNQRVTVVIHRPEAPPTGSREPVDITPVISPSPTASGVTEGTQDGTNP